MLMMILRRHPRLTLPALVMSLALLAGGLMLLVR